MDFNFKKRGHSPEIHKLRTERKRILKPQKKTEGYRSTVCPNMARTNGKAQQGFITDSSITVRQLEREKANRTTTNLG